MKCNYIGANEESVIYNNYENELTKVKEYINKLRLENRRLKYRNKRYSFKKDIYQRLNMYQSILAQRLEK